MNESAFEIRLMKAEDFDAVAGIDEIVLGTARPEYYEMKFEKLYDSVVLCSNAWACLSCSDIGMPWGHFSSHSKHSTQLSAC